MPLNEDNEIEYWGNADPKCPYCDKGIEISEHELFELYNEDIHEIDCPYCHKKIFVSSDCSWTFSTDEQDL
jgi:uncharacterized Zn-finger protein